MDGMADGAAERTVHTGRWTLEHRFDSPWHYLPVEIGPGTAGLRVELEYERADGTVLDLGCLGPGGFRGWSGGVRRGPAAARPSAAARAAGAPATAGVAGRPWPAVAGGRPAHPHRALGRRADR